MIHKDNYPTVMLKLIKVTQENSNVKRLYFRHKLNSKPGQFVMIWMPQSGEKPMSIASDTGDEFSLAIADAGNVTDHICNAKRGDYFGVRGPIGTYFNLGKAKSIALIGGGYGSGPMASLAELAIQKNIKPNKIHYIIGARSKNLLLFNKRLEGTGVNIHITTDDGSHGNKGLVTDSLKRVLEKNKIDKIFTVGPELMMKAVYDLAIANKIDIEISLERYTKCGIGICGSCVVDPTGERMCIEGPVIGKNQIGNITEFGVYHRDPSGNKIYY